MIDLHMLVAAAPNITMVNGIGLCWFAITLRIIYNIMPLTNLGHPVPNAKMVAIPNIRLCAL